jgi:hypothetical protein
MPGFLRRCVVVATAVSLIGCESIPRLNSPVAGTAAGSAALRVVRDMRTELSRSSLVERSGQNPIVLLGDDRFDVRPIDLLDQEVAAALPALSAVAISKFDVRYIQGGNLDSMTYGIALGVSGAGAILGTMLYGAMAGHARSKNPSSLEILIEGTVSNQPFVAKHGEALTGANEPHEVRRVVEASVKKAAVAIKETLDEKK